MANLTALRIALDARDPVWELPPVSGGAPVALIGWITDVEFIDAGVPTAAAAILARGLTRRCRVTFPFPGTAPAEWQQTPEGWVRTLAPPGFGRKPIPLLSTTLPEAAARLFDAHPFSWVLGSQVAFLSDLESPPPGLSYRTVRALLAGDPVDPASLAAEAQVRGVLAPAVDGDFAALIVFDPGLRRGILDALAEECSLAGVNWEMVTETRMRGR